MKQPSRDRGADEGFTLLEVVVSMLIFAVLSTATLTLIVRTLSTTGQASQRQVAANLADAQKEYLLGLPWTQVASASATRTVNGGSYTVTTAVSFQPDSGGSNCSTPDGAALRNKVVNISVTWPAMGGVTPVRTDTVLPIPMAESGNVKGALAWQVVDASNAPLPGVPAVLTNLSGAAQASTSSDASGCVYFSGLDAGSYGVTVDQPGYVTPQNQKTLQAQGTVALGKVTVLPRSNYSLVGSARILTSAPSGYTVPNGVGAFLNPIDGVGSVQQRATCGAGVTASTGNCQDSTGLVTNLYPKAYSPSAGICSGSGGGSSITPTISGAVPQTTIPLGAGFFSIGPGLTTTLTGTVSVSAVNTGDSTCTGQTILLTPSVVANGTQQIKYALPQGTWRIRLTNSLGASRDTVVPITTTVPTMPVVVTAP